MKSSSSLFRHVVLLSGSFLVTSLVATSSAQAADTVYVCTRRASKGATQTYIAQMRSGSPMCNNKNHIGPTPLFNPNDFGVTGATGPQGPQGEKGAQGEQGSPGQTGPQGAQGETGPQGFQGIPGPMGMMGPKGDIGPRGEQGFKGDTGEAGAKGETGAKGEQGIQGERGEKGEQGSPGEKGDTGLAGEVGAKGDKGDKGDQGVAGEKGDKGDKGDQGIAGPKGETGPRGFKGEDGKDGKDGVFNPSQCVVLSSNSGAASTNESATLNCDAFDGKDNHNLFLLTYATSISPTSASLKNQVASFGTVSGAYAESVTVSTNASTGNSHVLSVTAVCCPVLNDSEHHDW